MSAVLKRKARGSVRVELARTVARVVGVFALFATLRGLSGGTVHLVATSTGRATTTEGGDLFAPFSPTVSILALFAGPLLLTAAHLTLRHLTRKATPCGTPVK